MVLSYSRWCGRWARRWSISRRRWMPPRWRSLYSFFWIYSRGKIINAFSICSYSDYSLFTATRCRLSSRGVTRWNYFNWRCWLWLGCAACSRFGCSASLRFLGRGWSSGPSFFRSFCVWCSDCRFLPNFPPRRLKGWDALGLVLRRRCCVQQTSPRVHWTLPRV